MTSTAPATQCRENRDLASFFVTKHSWKGKYKRILAIGSLGLSTYNPSSMEVTNQWPYSEIVNVAPVIPKGQQQEPTLVTGGNEHFTINFIKKGRKVDSMKFSSEYRNEILCEVLSQRHQFADVSSAVLAEPLHYNCYKHHWSEKKVQVVLEVGVCAVNQLNPSTGAVITKYLYKDIDNLMVVSDYPGGFIVSTSGFNRYHLFSCGGGERDDLLKKMVEYSWLNAGCVIRIKKDPISFEHYNANRFGKYSTDESVTSLYEFTVHKITTRTANVDPVKRLLALTESCLVERDPDSYAIVTVKPLNEIFALIRSPTSPQLFSIEYVKGQIRWYTSTDRDALLASLMDGVRASGNIDIHVKMTCTQRGNRLGPYSVPVDEEVESWHLKFFQVLPSNWNFNEAVIRFNANCAYSGLVHSVTQDGIFAQNKEKLIQSALGAFVLKEGDQDEISPEHLEQQFQALRRLVAAKAGFAAFTLSPQFRECLGIKIVKALKRNNDAVIHSAIDMLCALMQPMHDYYDLRQEQLNKSSLLASKSFLESLLDVLKHHVDCGTGALVVASMLDFLTFSLCAPYSETTDGGHFDTLLSMVADYGRPLFKLFQHPSLAIVKGAGLVMKAIVEEGDADIAHRMQELALAEGALPRHLHISMFSPSEDSRYLAFQQLSRTLVGLWIVDNEVALALMQRVLPAGLLNYLESTEKPPKYALRLSERNNLKMAEDLANKRSKVDKIRDFHPSVRVIERHVENVLQHWRERIGIPRHEHDTKNILRPVTLRRRRERIKSTLNWPMFYYQLLQDHSKPNLIWNYKTREELKDALENEMRAFTTDRELSAKQVTISWNHKEFEVQYNSLNEEIKIGDYYLRLLLEEGENNRETSSLTDKLLIKKPRDFFNDLYHRFLLSPKVNLKACCLQAMTIVYGAYHEEIGPFNDIKFLVQMQDKCCDKLERDRLLLFISKLILNQNNVKGFIDAGGVRVLVDLITLAHLHVNRAIVPTQTNVIEASAEMMAGSEEMKEWYFGEADKSERKGPFSFKEMKEFYEKGTISHKSKCWAQGLDGWKQLVSIPQLKWTLVASGSPVLNESELATRILTIFIKICECYPSRDSDGAIVRPLPKVKRILSESFCLPHIVQLLLTFDPVLVERVATLLALVMPDNPNLPRLYLSGLFYFILMYTGSNLLPIGGLLHMSHANQSFRSEDKSRNTNILQRSVLGQLLPEAMVCFLDNYGPEKFAQIFLGEFDTPEAIWNGEMRRLMIEKIATHIADFSPRLRSNTRALYQYCPIPPIQYPQLENELFCNIYYLKNLCDTQRFSNWPIKKPVDLLRDILEAWKEEVEKKPPSMSTADAYDVLELRDIEGAVDENQIRKAYFKLAQKYHPDKNPEGRDKFDEISRAYEFLCSKNVKRNIEGPDPVNITLILKAQSILFNQCSEELQPYKYAGYPALVKTLRIETQDDQLFSKPYPLLAHACETAYHTVNCSALNAEELRREGGLEILQEALSRCVSVLSASSTINDVAVQVSIHIIRCFTVAASFPACRQRITEMISITRDISRVLYFSKLTKLCLFAVESISAFAADPTLQIHLFEAGVIFSLLLSLFKYDFTLEEGGVESNEESNQQEVANRLAKRSIVALAKLAADVGLDEKNKNITPTNHLIKNCLNSLLTPYLAKQLKGENVADLLKMLNSNIENPYLMWNNATRAELIDYLETQQREKIRSGECPDESYGADFTFSSHEEELVVGEIFVRIYTNQPMFPLDNAREFTRNLLDYVGSQAQYLHSAMALESKTTLSPERLKKVEMCLQALFNVIKYNNGVENECIGHFRLLFSLLRLDQWPQIQLLAVNAITCVTGNQDCVADIASSGILVYLLLVLRSTGTSDAIPRQTSVVEALVPLMSNSKLVKEALAKGAVLYLLDLFANSTNANVREKCAELLAKMTSDKLVGPKLRLILFKFLPSLFVDAMKDSPQAAVHLFDGTQENPELIWNDVYREKVCATLKKMTEELYVAQSSNPTTAWKLPEDFELKSPLGSGEIMIAGVYLRLFVQNPSWVLRRPKEFLTELLDAAQALMSKQVINENHLELVTKALTSLLLAQPTLLEMVPIMGHIQGFINNLSSKKHEDVPKSCILVLRQLANSKQCVDSMIGYQTTLHQMITAIKSDQSVTIVVCETLEKMFQVDSEELVHQAIKAELVPYLLKLLDSGQSAHSSGTKAVVVQVLKSMLSSETYGEQVGAMLDKSSVWSEFKHQKHDLFITNTATAGYLTAGTANVAGYLTQGSPVQIPSSPPPMEEY